LSDELRNKLGKLYQKRKARETIQLLSEEIRMGIDLNDLSYKEDVYSLHRLQLFPKGIDGKLVNPEGYSKYEYSEVDQLPHLVSCIEKACLTFDGECLVALDTESGYWPLKQGYVAKFIDSYLCNLKNEYQQLMIFQSDFKKGIVVDSYCGYLPSHLITNASEVVYEFIRWEKI